MGREDILQLNITKYDKALKNKAFKRDEIEKLKKQIDQLEVECNEIDIILKETENIAQAEIYNRYSQKDLLKLKGTIEKFAKKDVVIDFKELIEKFDSHDLKMNDINQLETYINLYGNYLKKEGGFFKGLFKALGGRTDG